jgi:hypothetical protein
MEREEPLSSSSWCELHAPSVRHVLAVAPWRGLPDGYGGGGGSGTEAYLAIEYDLVLA